MIRILFAAVMVATGSVALAHEEKECMCLQADESLSFREEVLSDFYPLTRQVIKEMLLADEGGNGLLHNYRVVPGKGLRITFPPMAPQPIKLDFELPKIDITTKSFDLLVQNDLLPSTLAEMRIPKDVMSHPGDVFYIGGLAFQR